MFAMDRPANSPQELPQPPKRNPRPPRSGAATQNMMVFGLLWLFILSAGLGGIVFIGQGVWLQYNGSRSTSWPSVPGTIVESKVRAFKVRLFGRDHEPSFRADVTYEFYVAGMPYTGDTISFNPGSTHPMSVTSRVQQYPLGKTVLVYYDPEDPSRSVLQPGSGGITITLFTGFMLLGGAIGMIWVIARLKKETSSRQKSVSLEEQAAPPPIA